MPSPESTGLLAAMLAFQSECPTLPKDRSVTVKIKQGGEYTYSYTPLDTIVEKTQPILTKNALVWSAKPSFNPAYGPSLKYKLSHAPSKEFEDGEMPLCLSEEETQVAQSMGSAITYMRRYAFCAVLNIVAEMDDDGALATGGGGRGAGALASDKQKKFLRTLITQKNLNADILDRLFAGVQFAREDGEKANDAINRLNKNQCSGLIETIKDGPIPNGVSDVPADPGDFAREPVDPEPMFDPSVAS
jgi:hypothetical protein